MSAARQPRPSSPDPGRCRDDRRGGGPRRGPAEPGRPRRGRRRARRRRPAARPVLDAGRRRRGDARRRRHRRRPQRDPALGGARAGPGGAGACSPRPSSASGRRSPTASTTTSTSPSAFTPEDLEALEKRMRQIVKDGQLFSRRVYESKDEAREELADEPYKLELVDDKSGDPEVMEVGGDELTAYDNLNPRTRERVWGDLCRGPHIPTTQLHSGVQADPQLGRVLARRPEQRQPAAHLRHRVGVAGGAGPHLELIEEAQRRDHRKLGAELDLFSFPDEIGSGLAVFHPKGGIVRRELEDYSRRKHIEAGYEFVNTPHITKAQLFKISGHLDWYADGMFPPMHLDAEYNEDGTVRKPGQDYYLKPMNCPMHCLIYRSRGRSYRELPLRLFEFGTVYRYEMSGVVHGLTRVRGLTHGRRAHLLHPRSDARRADVAAAVRARPARRLRPRRLLPGAVHQGPGQVRRLRRDVGGSHRARWPRSARRPGWTWCPTRAARRSTARRSRCRSRTRWAAAGRCRRSSWTSTSRSGSSWSTPPPTAAGSGR